MRLQLHGLEIHLSSESPPLRQAWQRLFAGWLVDAPPSRPADIRFSLELVEALDGIAQERPYFTDADRWAHGEGILSVYHGTAGHVWLHYHDGALIEVPLEPAPGQMMTLRGTVTEGGMRNGRFEDVTFTSLAPLLRRRGYYLAHAFAASHDDCCVLIVGPSGSGKTTTGLSLLLGGWRLLSNDAVLLEARPDGVYALPTPGDIGIRPPTLRLLPELQPLAARQYLAAGAYQIPGDEFVKGEWSGAKRVTAVLLPHVEKQAKSALLPEKRAISLTQIMAESVDRWDQATLLGHINLLERLCNQSQTFSLKLGADVRHLPHLIAASCA